MEKNYLVTFKAKVELTGTVQITNNGLDGILRKAREVVERNVNVEGCVIELGTENSNNDLVTIKEICTTRNIGVSDIIELN